MVYVQRPIEQRSVAVRSFLLIVATLVGWEIEGVRGVIIATMAMIFMVAVAEAGMAIRDGRTLDPGLAVAVALSPVPFGRRRNRWRRWSHRSPRSAPAAGRRRGPSRPAWRGSSPCRRR